MFKALTTLLQLAAVLPAQAADCSNVVFSANPNYPPFHLEHWRAVAATPVE